MIEGEKICNLFYFIQNEKQTNIQSISNFFGGMRWFFSLPLLHHQWHNFEVAKRLLEGNKSRIRYTLSACTDSRTNTKKNCPPAFFNVSYVTCPISCVKCHVSYVMCHMSLVTCHVSPVSNKKATAIDPPSTNCPTMRSRLADGLSSGRSLKSS